MPILLSGKTFTMFGADERSFVEGHVSESSGIVPRALTFERELNLERWGYAPRYINKTFQWFDVRC